MARYALSILIVAILISAPLAAETWQNVPIVDTMCLSKVKDNPDAHPTSCLMSCASSGYGILTSKGDYLKFNDEGNQKALAALKQTDKKDHVRVTVDGDRQGDTIKVKSVSVD